MKDGCRLEQPSPTSLSTELRILALIKMGITERYQIADILNLSHSTVYPYLSKIKGNLKNPSVSLESLLASL